MQWKTFQFSNKILWNMDLCTIILLNRGKEGVAHTMLNFPIGVAWKIGEVKLFSYVEKNHLKLMSALHIFKTWALKAIYCWKYANNLNLNQAKCNFPEFHRSNKGVSRTFRKTASLKQNHFSINTFFEFIAKNLSP